MNHVTTQFKGQSIDSRQKATAHCDTQSKVITWQLTVQTWHLTLSLGVGCIRRKSGTYDTSVPASADSSVVDLMDDVSPKQPDPGVPSVAVGAQTAAGGCRCLTENTVAELRPCGWMGNGKWTFLGKGPTAQWVFKDTAVCSVLLGAQSHLKPCLIQMEIFPATEITNTTETTWMLATYMINTDSKNC